MNVEPSPEIWHRDDFPILCNWRKLWRAAEVGVERGVWAEIFLSRWQGYEWWGVDDYEPYPEMMFSRECDFHFALRRLEPFSNRAKLIRAKSVEAAAALADEGLDFVYIDGAHDYQSVRADLRAWYPKIAPGGILAGHDFDEYPLHEGVKRAVKELAAEIGQTVYLTSVEGYGREACPSWYLYRDGMPGRDWRRC